MSHTTDGTPGPGRRADRADRTRRKRRTGLAWWAGGLAVLLVGYGALDAADAVPGLLTTQPPIEVQALPRPSAVAAEVAGPSPLPEDAPVPQDLASLVEPVLEEADLTGRLAYDVRDALTGDVLLAQGEDTASTPASVTKVLTGAAALGALGADARFTTRTVLDDSSGSPVVHVVGGGDVLLGEGESDPDTVLGRAGLATLAQRTAEELSAAGVSSVRVAADLSRYSGDGWHSGWDRADIGSGYITPIVPLMQESGFEEPGQRYSSRYEDAAGVALVISADPVTDWGNPNVIRSSKGTVFSVPVVSDTTEAALSFLAEHGIALVATTPDTDVEYTDIDYTGPVAVAVGAEKTGLTDQVLQAATHRVRIPMVGRANSLNVSTSAAIVTYEAVRQRRAR